MSLLGVKMMSGLFSTPAPDVTLVLDGSSSRHKMQLPDSIGERLVPIYDCREPISGSVSVAPKGRRFEYSEIRVELAGSMYVVSPEEMKEFMLVCREVARAGAITQDSSFAFAFPRAEKPYETYFGLTFRVRYALRMTIVRPSGPNITKDLELWIQSVDSEPGFNPAIKLEAGLPDLIQLEFELFASKFPLDGCVMGKVYFISVQTKIQSMELSLLRRESVNMGVETVKEHEILGRFEVMDGQPVRSDSVPIRLFLVQFPLNPTYRNICGAANVRYFLNLVVTDEDERKMYIRQEVELWRQQLGPRPALSDM